MRYVFASILAISSLLPILMFSNLSAADEFRAQRVQVKFEECESQTLRLDLNVANRTPKADLVEALKLFADYPNMVFTPVDADRVSLAFEARPVACADAKCARDVGFNEIQLRLKRYKGVEVSCAALRPDAGSAQEEPPGQSAPKREDGGVTTGN